ncbi:MAG: SAM-dependent DNA methyltransferase [Planctomycetes bacterium]|nr:SAM-dependent DNA methyltransferase [Planctomycetota bacterium]
MRKTRERAVFGDFQTPLALALDIVSFIRGEEPEIRAVVEPTCGTGSFLRAAAELLGPSPTYFGFDINRDYVGAARSALKDVHGLKWHVECGDFYKRDWEAFLSGLSSPVLVVGNPPWVTNAAMRVMGGRNLPAKTNFQRHTGFAARTGKANFDISEWMLIRLLGSLQGLRSVVAMLCKVATARRVLRHAWLHGLDVGPSSLHMIDAQAHFGASVEACLLYTHTGTGEAEATATVYPGLCFDKPLRTFGLFGGELVSDIDAYRAFRDIDGLEYRKWRSGVKHDAAGVMEFRLENSTFVNGFGERYDLEPDCLYPLLKSSDLANGRLHPSRFVLLTQHRVTDDPAALRASAPRTWQYLLDHAEQLDGRSSSIYSQRPRFSIFGVGDYTFAPWKVAISGLYKNLRFEPVGSFRGKPIVLDDTCYFIPCESEPEALFFARLLNSTTAQRFISSLIFTDAKRPITVDVLKRVDLKKLAEHVGKEGRATEYLASPALEASHQRLLVFEERAQYRRRTPKTSR